MIDIQKNENVVDWIKRKCKSNEITMETLLKRSGVTRDTLRNWRRKTPTSMENFLKLIETINEIENEKKELEN
jgi:transcriptional regulator with XRE-family HTH domain